jgi:hypothetical protein
MKADPAALPMGWTKIQRKRRASTFESSGEVAIDDCCDDPSYRRTPARKQKLILAVTMQMMTAARR